MGTHPCSFAEALSAEVISIPSYRDSPQLGPVQQSDATRLRVSQSAYDCLMIAVATPKAKAKRRIVASLFAACDRPDGPVPVFALA
jgi:hypothetical protein